MDLIKLKKIHGDVQQLVCPSGLEVVIRQQNGDDDDVLSNGILIKDGSSAVEFIASLVVDSSIGILDIAKVFNMRLADKYFIIVASRIFSIGQIVKFTFDWGNDQPPLHYEEDLSVFIWDYAKPLPEKNDPDYSEFRIPKVEPDSFRELLLSSGKKIKYDFMNGHGEKYLMTLPINKQSKNQELMARRLALETPTGFTLVQSFKSFSPHDMMQIRNDVEKHDKTLELFSKVVHPTTGAVDYLSILGTTDFFYPREI